MSASVLYILLMNIRKDSVLILASPNYQICIMVRKEMSYTIKIVGVICNTATTGKEKMGYFCMCQSHP